MRRPEVFLLTFFLFLNITCFAEDISVNIDNRKIDFDVVPVIQNDRTLVPMRKIFEELGCSVEWIPEARVVIATKNSKIISLQIDKTNIILTDIETGETIVKEMDTAPVIYMDRTMVPVRVISECLGCTVEWNGENKTVDIKTS